MGHGGRGEGGCIPHLTGLLVLGPLLPLLILPPEGAKLGHQLVGVLLGVLGPA